MDAKGAVVARSESRQPEERDAIVEVAREMRSAGKGAQPEAVGISFPDPDPKSWPDLTFLSAAVGEGVTLRTLSIGNATALAEVWYGAGRGARDVRSEERR